MLYFIEQGLMTQDRQALRVGSRRPSRAIPLMATIQDFDWADEVLHAQIGREWYIPQFGDWKQALDYGDQCWSRILSNWQAVRDQGLTAARELVAGHLLPGLPPLGHRARSGGAGVRRDLRGQARRPQGRGLTLLPFAPRKVPGNLSNFRRASVPAAEMGT